MKTIHLVGAVVGIEVGVVFELAAEGTALEFVAGGADHPAHQCCSVGKKSISERSLLGLRRSTVREAVRRRWRLMRRIGPRRREVCSCQRAMGAPTGHEGLDEGHGFLCGEEFEGEDLFVELLRGRASRVVPDPLRAALES